MLRCRSWVLAEALGDHILWPNVPVAYGEGWVWKLWPKHHKVGSTCGGANPRPNMPTHLTSGLHKADLQQVCGSQTHPGSMLPVKCRTMESADVGQTFAAVSDVFSGGQTI